MAKMAEMEATHGADSMHPTYLVQFRYGCN